MKRTRTSLVDYLAEQYDPETPLWVSVLHGQIPEQAEKGAELIQDGLSVAKLEILRVSPVLGVHTGPGIVETAVMPMILVEEFM